MGFLSFLNKKIDNGKSYVDCFLPTPHISTEKGIQNDKVIFIQIKATPQREASKSHYRNDFLCYNLGLCTLAVIKNWEYRMK